MDIGLLDYLVFKTSPTFMSSLRAAPGVCASAIRSIEDARAFDVDDWNEAGAYLCPGYATRPDCESARSALVEALEQTCMKAPTGAGERTEDD